MAAGKKEKNARQKRSVRQNNSGKGSTGEGRTEKEPLNHEQQKIFRWLKTVKFRRMVLGGVDERDVWKRLEELNAMYEAALGAERARYDALIEHHAESAENRDISGKQEFEPTYERDEDAQK